MKREGSGGGVASRLGREKKDRETLSARERGRSRERSTMLQGERVRTRSEPASEDARLGLGGGS